MAATTPRRPISIDELAQAIHVRIMTGEIPLGTWLRQERLAAEFGVSRTPVREAIRALQSAGIVELVPNRGARVRGPSLRDIREAYVIRAELEGLAAELAAERMTGSALRNLREAELMFAGAARAFRAMDDGEAGRGIAAQSEWSAANDRFHLAVQEAADNRRLSRLIAELHSAFPRSLTSRPLLEAPRLIEENVEQHRAIREALERHHPVASRAAMHAHVLRAGELVSQWFAEHRDD